MNKVKPYLFWIVCGVVVLVELVLLLFVPPSGKDGRAPTEIKNDLDAKNKDLDALFLKAKAGSPSGRTFDAENDKDIADLTSNWLATPAWKQVLDNHVTEYSTQIGKIHDYLVTRSRALHQPISTSTVKFDWYTEYETKTAELLQKLYDNQALVTPKSNTQPMPTPNGGVPGPGGGGAQQPGADASDATEAAPDFKKSGPARTVAGFLTTTQYPDPERFNELTTQFRVMELVAAALVDAKATNETSPVAPNKQTFEAHAQLAGTSWKDATDEAVTVQLTLNGPLSAVLAAEAALETNREDSLPIKVVTGTSLTRKSFLAGERRDITSEPVVLKVTLAVLDFTNSKLPEVAPPAAAAPAARPPAPPKPPKAASGGAAGGEE